MEGEYMENGKGEKTSGERNERGERLWRRVEEEKVIEKRVGTWKMKKGK